MIFDLSFQFSFCTEVCVYSECLWNSDMYNEVRGFGGAERGTASPKAPPNWKIILIKPLLMSIWVGFISIWLTVRPKSHIWTLRARCFSAVKKLQKYQDSELLTRWMLHTLNLNWTFYGPQARHKSDNTNKCAIKWCCFYFEITNIIYYKWCDNFISRCLFLQNYFPLWPRHSSEMYI